MEVNEPRTKYLARSVLQQTDVGFIPIDWQVRLLGELGKFSKGQGIRKDEAASGDIPCVRYGEIYTHHTDFVRTFNSRISQEVARTSKRLKSGDLLFAGSGETKAEIGKCVAFLGDEEAYVGGDIVVLSPTSGEPKFLGYLLNSPVIARQKASKGQGDAVVHIGAHALSSVQVPLPSTKAEQEAIANVLSDADALIESLEQLLVKKRQIKQGTMQELLTGKRRLPGFDGEWEMKRLGDVADTDPENLSSDTRPDFSFNYISLEDVDEGSLTGHSEQLFESAPSRARRKLRSHDVLVSTVRPNLRSHLLFQQESNRWICSTGFCVVRCKTGMSHHGYVYAHMFGGIVNRQIESLLTGSNYPAINSRDVRALEIPFPSYAEQSAIATILSDMDADIAALESRLVKVRHIKLGMMQQLLTGTIRLV